MIQLYVSTTIMLLAAISIVIGVAKLSKMKSFIYNRDVLYTKKFDALEHIIKKDIKTILEILKDENHKLDKK